MAQRYFVAYGQDADDHVLYFLSEGLDDLLLQLSDLARELADVNTVADWLASFFVFPDGTSAEKAALACALFIIEGQPGDADPVFPEEDDTEDDLETKY